MSRVIGLRQAMPYLRLYQGKVFIIKIGGALLASADRLEPLAHQIALLHQLHIRPVIVHGGGPQATELAVRMGVPVETVNGRRVTDAETLELCKMAFNGRVNTDLLAALNRHHVPAVGISGVDAAWIQATRRPPVTLKDADSGKRRRVDFGFVGEIESIDPELIRHLLAGNLVPVISSLATGPEGGVLNVNADTVAARLAVGIRAEKLILLTQVTGVMRDPDVPESLISHMDLAGLEEALAQVARGGMHAKLEACREALQGGVPRTHIINGLERDSLLVEVFTNEGCGTLIEKEG